MVTGKFKYGHEQVPMELGWRLAHDKLFDLGLDILTITKDPARVIQTILLDDSTMLKVWFYYVSEAGIETDFMEALDVLDREPEGLEPFKKAFWDLVVGFTNPSLRDILNQGMKEIKKELRNAPEKIISTSTSASQPEVE